VVASLKHKNDKKTALNMAQSNCCITKGWNRT